MGAPDCSVSAALFSGNAIVVKVSEHAAWSAAFYGRLIECCLAAAGAPTDLVQLVTGYAETGAALTSAVEMMTFVGSTKVRLLARGWWREPWVVATAVGGGEGCGWWRRWYMRLHRHCASLSPHAANPPSSPPSSPPSPPPTSVGWQAGDAPRERHAHTGGPRAGRQRSICGERTAAAGWGPDGAGWRLTITGWGLDGA